MKLGDVRQISPVVLRGLKPDAIVVSSGYESRALNVVASYPMLASGRRFVIGFDERRILARDENDYEFDRNGFTQVRSAGGDHKAVNDLLDSIVLTGGSNELSIVVDYSCMTKIWYGAVLSYFASARRDLERITLYFCYSPSKFRKPPESAPNAFMGPIPGFCSLSLPNRETALVIGLGYERDRAMGLSEYVDARETYLFYATTPFARRFTSTVVRNNRDLMDRVGPSRVFSYPFEDITATNAMLVPVCLGASKEYRVILAPLGPKPFALLSMLISLRYPWIDVWRVSAEQDDEPVDRPAVGPVLCVKVEFLSDARIDL